MEFQVQPGLSGIARIDTGMPARKGPRTNARATVHSFITRVTDTESYLKFMKQHPYLKGVYFRI